MHHMRYPVGDGAGFAASSAGQNKHRAIDCLGRLTLWDIELIETENRDAPGVATKSSKLILISQKVIVKGQNKSKKTK